MLTNHHDLFGRQSPVKVQSCILVRPNKGPPSPLSHMAIRSTNTWVSMTHFTDDLYTGHLNFRIIKWNNLRLAKMPIRLVFKNPSLFGKNFQASRLITNYPDIFKWLKTRWCYELTFLFVCPYQIIIVPSKKNTVSTGHFFFLFSLQEYPLDDLCNEVIDRWKNSRAEVLQQREQVKGSALYVTIVIFFDQ